MRKSLVVTVLILSLSFLIVPGDALAGAPSGLPDDYYDWGGLVSDWMQGHDLHTVLSNIEWTITYEYLHFDCTHRVSLMMFIAENAGHDSVMGCDFSHCWILVDFDGEWRAYDSMTFGGNWDHSRYYPRSHTARYNPSTVYERAYDYRYDQVNWWDKVDWHNPFTLTILSEAEASQVEGRDNYPNRLLYLVPPIFYY